MPDAPPAAIPNPFSRPSPTAVAPSARGLHDVGAAQESAVDQDLGAARHRLDHLRQHVDAPAAVVELASAVVGDVDHVDAHVAREHRVLAGRDALEHQRDVETVPHPASPRPR